MHSVTQHGSKFKFGYSASRHEQVSKRLIIFTMETSKKSMRKLFKETSAVFGLTAVQAFFGIILGLALLAYVIVIIMGSLNTSTLIPLQSGSVINETTWFNQSADNLNAVATNPGFTGAVITSAVNGSNLSQVISSGNWSLTSGGTVNRSNGGVNWDNASASYTFSAYAPAANQLQSITANTSSGITSFFGNVSPVYAILAILVIIMVLIVLVRVVTNNQQSSASGGTPAL